MKFDQSKPLNSPLYQKDHSTFVRQQLRIRNNKVQNWCRTIESAWPCLSLLSLMFVPQIGSLGLAGFLFFVGLSIFPIPITPWRSFITGSVVLSFPFLAMLSAAWSIEPMTSLRLGLELTITMLAGIMIGASNRPKKMIFSITAGLLIYLIIAIVLGRSVVWGANGGTAFAGLNESKNFFGDFCSLTFISLFSLALISTFSRSHWRLVYILFCLTVCFISVKGTISSNSSGALLGLIVSSILVTILYPMLLLGKNSRFVAIALAIFLITSSSIILLNNSTILTNTVLQKMNKDSGLTGRAYIWYRAEKIINESPILGLGYGAFWVQGNPDAEGLWRYNRIDNRSGFNFHNTAIEEKVSLGLLGLSLLVLLVFIGLFSLVLAFLIRPLPLDLFWIGTSAYQLTRVGFESIVPSPFSQVTIMMTASLVYGITRITSVRRDSIEVWTRRSRMP